MKITKKILKQIILEEIQNEMKASEFHPPWGPPVPEEKPEQNIGFEIDSLVDMVSNLGNIDRIKMFINKLGSRLPNLGLPIKNLQEGCGCQEDHGEILVAYDSTGKEVMRSNAFKGDEAGQLQALIPVLQAQGLQVEIIPAPHDHPMAVSVDDAPEEKIH